MRSIEIVVLSHHVILNLHLILVRVPREICLLYLHLHLCRFLHWFHRSRLFGCKRSFFLLGSFQKRSKKALDSPRLLLFRLRLFNVHNRFFDDRLHLLHLSFFRFFDFVGDSLIHSPIFAVEGYLLSLELRFLEVIIHIIWPLIIVLLWAQDISSRVHSSSIGGNSLMNYTDICLFLHFLLLSRGLWLWTNDSEEFSSFGTWVSDLRLEWNFLEIVNINL